MATASPLQRNLLKEYQALGQYLREAVEEGKGWVEKLFGLRLYRFPQKEALMEEWLQQVENIRTKGLGQVHPIFPPSYDMQMREKPRRRSESGCASSSEKWATLTAAIRKR